MLEGRSLERSLIKPLTVGEGLCADLASPRIVIGEEDSLTF